MTVVVTAEKIYSMLGNAALWETAVECHRAFLAADIPHVICGGVSVCLHGYQRNTTDIDLIVNRESSDAIRQELSSLGWEWQDAAHEFRSRGGIAVQFLYAGDRAGHGSTIRLPDPSQPETTSIIDGLPSLTLARLIEVKIACGEGNIRRTHKDLADVVELIAIHQLNGSFAAKLHRSVRKTFRELVRHAAG